MQKKSRSWWTDWLLVCLVLLLAESARGVVIGTLSPYLESLGGDSFFLGIVVAAFSVGRLVASFAFGALADFWSTRAVLLLSCVGCIVGNFMFALSATLGGKYLLLVSRLFTGFGTGMLSVARTHVSVTTPAEERTLWMSWLGIVQFVGFAITPVLGGVNVQLDLWLLRVSEFTFATLLLMLLEVGAFVCLLAFMSNQSSSEAAERGREEEKVKASAAAVLSVNGNDVPDSSSAYHQLDDDGPVDLDRQRSLPEDDDAADDQKCAAYLDDELHRDPPDLTAASNPALADWTPRTTALHAHERDVSSYLQHPLQAAGDSSQSALSALQQQRDVIVYMEEKTPLGRDVIFKPHHFIFSNDTAEPGGAASGTLIATSAVTEALPILTPANTSSVSFPPHPAPSRSARLLEFLAASFVPLVFVLLNLSGRGILSVAEAYGTKTYNDVQSPGDPNPSTSAASTFFLILGCLGLLVFLAMSRLVKLVEEANLLMLAFLAMGIGFGVICDFEDDDIDMIDFTAGMVLVWVIGTPISQTLSVSMLSKHFSQQQKAGVAPTKGVGFWMGLVTASGSVGRIIFPLVAGSLYEPFGSSSAFLFTSLVSFVTVPLIFFALKAYTPYLPWLKERFHCLLPADDEEQEDMQPHSMIRTGSNGDRTELLMLSGRHAPAPSQLTADPGPDSAAAGEKDEAERALSAVSSAVLPAIYFVPSQPSPHRMPAPQASTPLMRHGSLRNVGQYGSGQTSKADERGSLNSC